MESGKEKAALKKIFEDMGCGVNIREDFVQVSFSKIPYSKVFEGFEEAKKMGLEPMLDCYGRVAGFDLS